jgi:hypothetical protein
MIPPDPHLTRLGLSPDYTQEELRAAFAARAAGLKAARAPAAEHDALRDSHNVLNVRLRRRLPATEAVLPPPGHVPPAKYVPPARPDFYDPAAYDNPWVTALAPVVVAAVAMGIAASPLGFFLNGFHVWVHEFGHATAAWLMGFKATPLPIGWTNIGAKTPFVYFGVLFLLLVLAAAGIKERKVWPVLIAAAVIPLQYYSTWRLPEHRVDFWKAFSGPGGELYLSAAAMALFHVRLPEKFRWGWCRYLFVFLGAASFGTSYGRWRDIRYGREPLPFGSMVGGEEDAGGDLNILQDDYGWTDRQIIANYNQLAQACLIAVIAVHLFFALGLNRLLSRLWTRPESG